jgi:cyanate lyase
MVLVWENNTTEEYIMCCYMFLLLQVLEKDLTKGIIRSHKSKDIQYNDQKEKRGKVQTMMYKALHRKLKIE